MGEAVFDTATDYVGDKVGDAIGGPFGDAVGDAVGGFANDAVGGMFDWFDLDDSVGPGKANKDRDVEDVNGFLGNAGFMKSSGGMPSGLFSAETEDSVKAFQGANGLKQDGILNPGGPTMGEMKKQVGGITSHYARQGGTPDPWLPVRMEEAAKAKAEGKEVLDPRKNTLLGNEFPEANKPKRPSFKKIAQAGGDLGAAAAVGGLAPMPKISKTQQKKLYKSFEKAAEIRKRRARLKTAPLPRKDGGLPKSRGVDDEAFAANGRAINALKGKRDFGDHAKYSAFAIEDLAQVKDPKDKRGRVNLKAVDEVSDMVGRLKESDRQAAALYEQDVLKRLKPETLAEIKALTKDGFALESASEKKAREDTDRDRAWLAGPGKKEALEAYADAIDEMHGYRRHYPERFAGADGALSGGKGDDTLTGGAGGDELFTYLASDGEEYEKRNDRLADETGNDVLERKDEEALSDSGVDQGDESVPVINNHLERKKAILQGKPAIFNVAPNPDADDSAPWYERHEFSEVKQNEKTIGACCGMVRDCRD